jgi:hypothetical protein
VDFRRPVSGLFLELIKQGFNRLNLAINLIEHTSQPG